MTFLSQISNLVGALRDLTEQLRIECQWRKSRCELATKDDLREMEIRMAIKVSELKTEVAGLRAQVQKIWGEQQAKYDALVVKYDELVKTLENQEISEEAEAEVTAFKAELKAFDDTIPDTTA